MKKLFLILFLDVATPWIVGFQEPATPIIIGIVHFYNHLIFSLVAIGIFVCILLFRAIVLYATYEIRTKTSKFTHSAELEVTWTIVPIFLLLFIAGPYFALLYPIDEVIAPQISLKVIGHQWYWSYEYSGNLDMKTPGINHGFIPIVVESHATVPLVPVGEAQIASSDTGKPIPDNCWRLFLRLLEPGISAKDCNKATQAFYECLQDVKKQTGATSVESVQEDSNTPTEVPKEVPPKCNLRRYKNRQ